MTAIGRMADRLAGDATRLEEVAELRRRLLVIVPVCLGLCLAGAGAFAGSVLRPDPAWIQRPAWAAERSPADSAEEVPVEALRGFTPEVRRWSEEIRHWSAEFDLPVPLVATVMQIESCGNPQVVSSAGAQGLFQVMPYHFAAGENPGDPETNARRGLAYLAGALADAGGQVDLALAGYNGGRGLITRPRETWPAETLRYVAWGMGILSDLESMPAESGNLQAWLAAGGAHLCARASQALDVSG